MIELRTKVGSPAKMEVTAPEADTEFLDKVRGKISADRIREALLTQGKHDRAAAKDALKEEAISGLAPEGDEPEALEIQSRVKAAFREVANDAERAMILARDR